MVSTTALRLAIAKTRAEPPLVSAPDPKLTVYDLTKERNVTGIFDVFPTPQLKRI